MGVAGISSRVFGAGYLRPPEREKALEQARSDAKNKLAGLGKAVYPEPTGQNSKRHQGPLESVRMLISVSSAPTLLLLWMPLGNPEMTGALDRKLSRRLEQKS